MTDSYNRKAENKDCCRSRKDSKKEKRMREIENSTLVKSIRRGVSNLVTIEQFERFDMMVWQYFYSKRD